MFNTTVNDIVRPIARAISKLDVLEEKLNGEINRRSDEMQKHMLAINNASDEKAKARRVRARLNALVEGETVVTDEVQ